MIYLYHYSVEHEKFKFSGVAPLKSKIKDESDYFRLMDDLKFIYKIKADEFFVISSLTLIHEGDQP